MAAFLLTVAGILAGSLIGSVIGIAVGKFICWVIWG